MNWCPTIGMKLAELGRVKESEFEVIEPKKEQHGNDESAGDGNNTGSRARQGVYIPDATCKSDT